MDKKVRAVKLALQMNQLDLVKKLEDLSLARKESDSHRDAIASIEGQHNGLLSNLREKMESGHSFNPDFIQWGLQYANVLAKQKHSHEQKLQVADDKLQLAYDQLTESSVTKKKLSCKKQEFLGAVWLERNLIEQKELEQINRKPMHGYKGQ